AEHARRDLGGAVGPSDRRGALVLVHRRSLPAGHNGRDLGSRVALVAAMQTTVERTAEHTVKLTIEVPSDQFDKDLDKTYRAIAREVKIPGFRPGKAPKPIIDAPVGHAVVREEFVNASVPSYFRPAVSDEDRAPIGDPDGDGG